MNIFQLMYDDGVYELYTYECTKTKNGYSVIIPDRISRRIIAEDELLVVKDYCMESSFYYSVWFADMQQESSAKNIIRQKMYESMSGILRGIEYENRRAEKLKQLMAEFDKI